jgi:hypothetical protein
LILVTWTLADGTKGSREFPDDQLEEVLRRTHAKFGTEATEDGGGKGKAGRLHAQLSEAQKTGYSTGNRYRE